METSSSAKQLEKKQISKLNLQKNATEIHSVLMERGEHWLTPSTHIQDMVSTSITFHNCSVLFVYQRISKQQGNLRDSSKHISFSKEYRVMCTLMMMKLMLLAKARVLIYYGLQRMKLVTVLAWITQTKKEPLCSHGIKDTRKILT